MNKKATIVDVARESGVSVKTVSRVINHSPNVSEVTKERVYEAMRKTRYQVNLLARGLKSSRTNVVVVFADRHQEEHLSTWHTIMLKYLFAYAQKKNLKLVLSPSSSGTFEQDQTDGFYLIANGLVDGAILLENVNNDQRIGYFEEHHIPYVVFGEADDERCTCVSLDNYQAGYNGGKYLLEIGYRSIAFLLGEERFRSSQLRMKGFEEAVKEQDCWYGIYPGTNTIEKAYRKAQEVMKEHTVRAFFVSGDERALGVYRAIYERGLSIPGDIAVLGIDNIPSGRFYYPPISTVAQNFAEMSKSCLDCLERQINGEITSGERVFPSEIIEREST